MHRCPIAATIRCMRKDSKVVSAIQFEEVEDPLGEAVRFRKAMTWRGWRDEAEMEWSGRPMHISHRPWGCIGRELTEWVRPLNARSSGCQLALDEPRSEQLA
jgi:hypothetical protein